MKNKQKVSSDKFTMMTQMPVNKLICKMAVPTIITMLVSAVYNMADTYFVGKIGTSATGAVGVVFSFMAISRRADFSLVTDRETICRASSASKRQKRRP